MKRILLPLTTFALIFCTHFSIAQHHVIVTDINEAYDYYQSSHEGAETALHFISEAFDCHSIDCIRENMFRAKTEVEAAMRNAHYAKDETHSAKSQAIDHCEVASSHSHNAHGSFTEAKDGFTKVTSTLSTAHYTDDVDEIHSHLNYAIDHIHLAISHLNNGVDGLNNALGELEYCGNR
ncbi:MULTISPECIES: hypothetical protein [Flammeovirga]|uniref:Uncharacterized protein n=1 Tax=Flammeovirga agarivorans TaxID=2726742 RepID=A0A7X8SHK9_9BACT|nr:MULTISPECIES: hypothetical protein [Flammeovirga]NLR90277.1 hypothetical protein [Flammeovirga agarivorans]